MSAIMFGAWSLVFLWRLGLGAWRFSRSRVRHERARDRRGSGGECADRAFARAVRRAVSPSHFYRGRDRVFAIDEISGAPFGGALRGEGSGFESVRHRDRKGDGLEGHRCRPQTEWRTISGPGRRREEAGGATKRLESFDYPQPHRASRDGGDRGGRGNVSSRAFTL